MNRAMRHGLKNGWNKALPTKYIIGIYFARRRVGVGNF